MARIAMPVADALNAQQKAVCDEVMAGKRGNVPTPMIAWLRNPALASRAQLLGELLRFDTSLPPRLTELAILICARHWTSHHEWRAHKRLALAAGLEHEAVAAIAANRQPDFPDPEGRIVYQLSHELLASGRLEPALYEQGIALLGETALVELVTTLGYYCLVSLTLNAFELGLPENFAPELCDVLTEAHID